MSDTKQSAEDLAILEQLNLDYIHFDQTNDVKGFRELLAEDFNARSTLTTLADGVDKEALYTDTYQKREGTWVCVAACALDPVPVA